MRTSRYDSRARGGFTLVELVLAAGLMALLMVAVFSLIGGSLSMWRKSETRRNLSEQGTAVAELLAHDLRGLEGGERGDLLVEWESFDTDGDGIKETHWPRLRMVRQASAAEMARMEPAPIPAAGATESELAAARAVRELHLGPALIEVCWAVLPLTKRDPDARPEGLVLRGARRLVVGADDSFFDDSFISITGSPDTSRLDEVSAGILWFQPLMATQTSIVHDGWVIGSDLADAATSWDAWNAERPDPTRHAWNVPGAGMPAIGEHALLPRRVRIVLEIERAEDRLRRTRTIDALELGDVSFKVDDQRLAPAPGSFIKLDGEWMTVRSRSGDQLTVKRAQRGTAAMVHDAGSLVHWGLPLVREVPVDLYREDWNL